MKYEIYIKDNDESSKQEVTKEIFELIEKLDEKVEDANEVIEFYADKKNWFNYKEYSSITGKDEDSRDNKGGKKAREYQQKYNSSGSSILGEIK